MKKLVAMGLFTDQNQGNPLIHKTVKALNFFICVARKLFCKTEKIARKLNSQILFDARIKLLSYCLKKHFVGTDGMILVGGGGIHYKWHGCLTTISATLLACKKLKIPMIINAVGIEGFDPKNPKCLLLGKYMRIGSLKYISTRDDLGLLREKYLKNDFSIESDKVFDPVVFCSKLFNVSIQKNDAIGVGLL